MELAHGCSVVHGVKGRNFVDSHRGHLEQSGDLVHDANASETVLSLAEIEQRHAGGLLVLRGVSLEDLGNDGLIFRVELEGDIGVVVWGISVLENSVRHLSMRCSRSKRRVIAARSAIGVSMAGFGGSIDHIPP